jgi:hypothetical protein
VARTTFIHVNQHKLRANRKVPPGQREPVLTVKDYQSNRYAFDAVIVNEAGEEVARVVYRPEKPKSCGAVLWMETKLEVLVDPEVEVCAGELAGEVCPVVAMLPD